MKFSLIVAVVVLALAQGSFAQDLPSLDKLGEFVEQLKTKMTEEMTKLMSNPELQGHAETVRSQLEPMVSQMQEQFRTAVSNVEEQLKPMTDGMQAQLTPVMENIQRQFETIFQMLTDQARAVRN